MALKERMPMLLEMRREHLATLQANAADAAKDQNGSSSSSVRGTLRFIGVAEFAVSGNVDLFRRYLSDAAKIQLRLFERHKAGDPIDDSYVAMLSYKALLDALAAADFATARRLALCMGGRAETEKKHDHPFDYCFGYTLKAFTERNTETMAHWATKFSAVCQQSDSADFAGYAEALNGILANDEKLVQQGLTAIVKGHKNQTKRGGVFKDLEDETLCVWGVGIANLARQSGLAVQGVPPFIPPQLIL